MSGIIILIGIILAVAPTVLCIQIMLKLRELEAQLDYMQEENRNLHRK